jgi:hypothetical protein
LQGWIEDQAECTLVLISATLKGRTKLVRFDDRVRESVQRWRELLVEIKRRGLFIQPGLQPVTRRLASGRRSTSSFRQIPSEMLAIKER